MSYYRPSFSQTVAMSRGRGFSSPRSSYRGGSNRGSWGGNRGSYSDSGSRFSHSYSNSFDSRNKYQGSGDRYSGSRGHQDDYRKPYRPDSSGYSGRDGHRSPDRKRMRTDSMTSRHDSSYGSNGYGNRYESNYQERRSFSNDRRPPPPPPLMSRREDFRKPAPPGSPRGGFRGRLSSRGGPGLRSRRRDLPVRRRLVEGSYVVRRRISRSAFFERRLRQARLRSDVRRSTIRKKKESEQEDSDDKEEVEEDEEEKEEKDTKEKEEDDDAEKDKEAPTESPKKSPKKEPASDKETSKETEEEEGEPKRRYVKLNCPHCLTKSPTFRKYIIHFTGRRHSTSMRRVAMKQKNILSQMRLAQRNAQRELEKNGEDLTPRTNFCPLCKLNYRQPKATHQNSDAHKNMKKFLMPYCKTCKITLKSPMLYEEHICSIEHLREKAAAQGDKSDASGDDENLENFMTIDSVGDVDEEEGEGKKKEPTSETKSRIREQINVGIEKIRKIEVHYCDLCRMYLPRVEDGDTSRILAKHCRQRTHMQRYIRFKEDSELTKRAENLQRKENAEKEKDKKVDESTNGDEDKKPDKEAHPDEEGEDKLWADVDKDLGDILAEAESGNKSSDEDDNGERYDRFKLSQEKNEDEKEEEIKNEEEEEEKDNEEDKEVAADTTEEK